MASEAALSPRGFLERPLCRELSDCDVVVLGVPFDLATTGRAGARMGPQGIRQASWQMSWEKRRWPWRFALADRLRVIDFGDVSFDPGDSAQLVDVLRARAREILAAGKTLLSLGGDHFISLPLLREHAAKYGAISLIHFDAHADTEPVEGAVHHGSMFRVALDEGLVDPSHSVQVGIRTEYESGDEYPFNVLDGVEVAPAYDHAEITSLAGATIAVELLHVLAADRGDLEAAAIR